MSHTLNFVCTYIDVIVHLWLRVCANKACSLSCMERYIYVNARTITPPAHLLGSAVTWPPLRNTRGSAEEHDHISRCQAFLPLLHLNVRNIWVFLCSSASLLILSGYKGSDVVSRVTVTTFQMKENPQLHWDHKVFFRPLQQDFQSLQPKPLQMHHLTSTSVFYWKSIYLTLLEDRTHAALMDYTFKLWDLELDKNVMVRVGSLFLW